MPNSLRVHLCARGSTGLRYFLTTTCDVYFLSASPCVVDLTVIISVYVLWYAASGLADIFRCTT